MKLSIIILNYNTRDLLDQTIKSIDTKLSHEIIVVDNASTDDSVAFLKKNHPNVKLIQNSVNSGFASGNNLGIKIAKGNYILLLNSDTKVLENALEKLVEFADQNQKIGIVTPKLILSDGAIDLSCHRGFPTLFNSLSYFARLESLLPNFKPFAGYHQTYKDFNSPHPVDVVSGAAMLIRSEVVKDIGILDERFFMYAEDIDYCLRAKQAGWQIYYYPDSVIVHLKGLSGTKSTNTKIKSKTRTHFYYTMKQYFDKHYARNYPNPINWLVHKSVDLVAKIRG